MSPKKGNTAVHCWGPVKILLYRCFFHVGVSKRLSRSISLCSLLFMFTLQCIVHNAQGSALSSFVLLAVKRMNNKWPLDGVACGIQLIFGRSFFLARNRNVPKHSISHINVDINDLGKTCKMIPGSVQTASYLSFSNQLIIHQVKTKEITTVAVVWISDLN